MEQLAFSQACENNKRAILEVIRPLFRGECTVLEVGSGTGQHGEYFAAELPQLRWQLADQAQYLPALAARHRHAQLPNLLEPLVLDVNRPWPVASAQHLFSANTVHIMGWTEVERFFAAVAEVLQPGGVFCLYGPFNYNGDYTSDSNASFDQWLKARDPASGIRDSEAIETLAVRAGLIRQDDVAMPANNRCLVWQKQS